MSSSQQLERFEKLLDAHEEKMVRCIGRILASPHDADDALQNVLTTLWKKIDEITTHPQPTALVLRICVDASYDVARRIRRVSPASEFVDLDRLVDPTQQPESDVARAELRQQLLELIQRLSPNQSTAIHLRFVEELPYEAIAAAIGCAEATARKHVQRGLSNLRTTLSSTCQGEQS